jgi:GDP-D-mannose 3',5'-epimerase
MRILVTGAGGFIGHHLVARLKREGHWVRGVDVKTPQYSHTSADEFRVCDLRFLSDCQDATRKIDYVYNLAADMGGIGYITSARASIARNNSLINLNMLEGARQNLVRRFLFSSSACIYPAYLQDVPDVRPLLESEDIPADPEAGYGWEKLYAEQLCKYYRTDYKLDTRIVRFHNVYGPEGDYDGGREKAPAALCRKIAKANDGDSVEVWGDGKQTRTFMYIDDCVEGLLRIMASEYHDPLNLGRDEMVTVDELFNLIAKIAGKTSLKLQHDVSKPQGVRGRNSDNTLLRRTLGWEPSIVLEKGLAITYEWINTQVKKQCKVACHA